MKFRKKPETIDAWEWDESKDTLDLIGCGFCFYEGHKNYPLLVKDLRIKTTNGVSRVQKGDWIIKHSDGFTVCGSVAFRQIYEPANP